MGLGLAIVKEIVELHGGTVTAESAGIDRGAAFIVTLPVETHGQERAAEQGDIHEDLRLVREFDHQGEVYNQSSASRRS